MSRNGPLRLGRKITHAPMAIAGVLPHLLLAFAFLDVALASRK
jgi:hypothetical protein